VSAATRSARRTARPATGRRPPAGGRARLRAIPALAAIPRAAWACALVAFLNAACWSLVTPPFQVPDEPDHVAYVQALVETGRLPVRGAAAEFSNEDVYALNDLHQGLVRFKPQVQSISSLAEQHKLERDLAQPFPHGEPLNAGLAAGEPPLYYALETIPYRLAESGTLLDRVQLMRLLSAAMAALTALFTFLFVRETLPGVRWAWTVGGLGVGLAPLLGFVSGGVNPESMLVAVCAAIFYLLARAFRRGLSSSAAIALGGLIAVGFLTKLNFVGLVPGVLLALGVLAVRAARRSGRKGLAPAALAAAIGLAPVLVYALVNALASRPELGEVSNGLHAQRGSLLQELGYVWQLYLPRLPGTRDWFPGILTTRHLWLDGFVGLYGWVDTTFPAWVYEAALVPTAIVAGLCVRALAGGRTHLRARAAEPIAYATMVVGLMALVGADSYLSETSTGTGPYWQPRYFLPLIPLLGLVLALAARGAGRRWGRSAGVLIVVLVFAHDLFSQLQLVARYYG
jgi:4-amino-4-deoxy-L-arabinose transferase-like glycosyltransferase